MKKHRKNYNRKTANGMINYEEKITLLIDKGLNKSVTSFTSYSEKILMVQLKTNIQNINLTQVYAADTEEILTDVLGNSTWMTETKKRTDL